MTVYFVHSVLEHLQQQVGRLEARNWAATNQGKRCLFISCCDYPPPVCGPGLGRIVQGMKNVRDASFKEKCLGTPRLGPNLRGIPGDPPFFSAYPRIMQVHTVYIQVDAMSMVLSLYSQLSHTYIGVHCFSLCKTVLYFPWRADLDVEQLVYYCCRTVRVDVNTIFQLLFLLWG